MNHRHLRASRLSALAFASIVSAIAVSATVARGDGGGPAKGTTLRPVTSAKVTLTKEERAQVDAALKAAAQQYAKDKRPAVLERGGSALTGNAARVYAAKAQTILAAGSITKPAAVGSASRAVIGPRYAVESGQIVYYEQLANCDVTIQFDLVVKNRGTSVPPAPSLAKQVWVFNYEGWVTSPKTTLPALAAGATTTARISPPKWNLGKKADGTCRPIGTRFDLYFSNVETMNDYSLFVGPNEARLETMPEDYDPLGIGNTCPYGTCADGRKCILPAVGCDY